MKKIQLLPDFSLSFKGIIFRMLTDQQGRLLAVEVRNETAGEASFSAIDLQTGNLLFSELGLEEPWWIGMAAVENGKLFFYHLADRRFPDPKGIVAVDVFAQEILWDHRDMYFEQVSGNLVVAARLSEAERRYYLLDIESGEIRQEISAEQVATLPQPVSPIIQPHHYPQDSDYFSTVATFLRRRFNIDPAGAIDYADYGNYIAVSYHLPQGNGFSNFLLLINREGEMLFHEQLISGTKGLAMGTFFMIDHWLLTIKNKNELLGFKLINT